MRQRPTLATVNRRQVDELIHLAHSCAWSVEPLEGSELDLLLERPGESVSVWYRVQPQNYGVAVRRAERWRQGYGTTRLSQDNSGKLHTVESWLKAPPLTLRLR